MSPMAFVLALLPLLLVVPYPGGIISGGRPPIVTPADVGGGPMAVPPPH